MTGEGKRPFVSVVIPTYHRSALVTRAIRSALQQSVQDTEVIVVDDASPDETELAVRAINDPRIRYIRHERNKGLPATRNTGIRAAMGEFIAFLDDDDEWFPEKTEKQLRCISDYRLDAVVSLGLIDGKVLSDSHERVLITLDDLRKGNKWGSCTLLVKAAVMKDVMFDEGLNVGEDWDAYIRIVEKYRMGCLNEPLFVYYQVGQHASAERMIGAAKDKSPSELEKRAAMLQKHRAFFGERWFKYHMAGVLLSYIGRRSDKLRYIRYAVGRCGVRAVLAVFAQRMRWHVRRLRWILAGQETKRIRGV